MNSIRRISNVVALVTSAVLANAAPATPFVADPAQHEPSQPPAEKSKLKPLKAGLIIERTTVQPGGSFDLGLTLEMEKGWHTYWPGDNDSGMPLKVEFMLPAGFEAGEIKWPAPARHVADGDIVDYVYFDRVTLIVPIKVGQSVKPGDPGEIKAKAEWMVCHEACLLGDAELATKAPHVVKQGDGEPTPAAPWFAASRARLPKPAADAGKDLATNWKDGRLNITFKDAAELTFMPAAKSMHMEHAAAAGTIKGNALSLEFSPGPENAKAVLGVLEVKGKDGKPRWFDLAVPAPAAPGVPGGGK